MEANRDTKIQPLSGNLEQKSTKWDSFFWQKKTFSFVLKKRKRKGFITYISTGWMIEGLPRYSLGYVNLPIVLSVASVSVLTAPLGAKLSSKYNKKTLKKIFSIFLLLICVSLVIDQYY